MATTTNYAWDTPDDTDLVKDGAAAIRTLGSSVDTTTKNLNPQTTTGALAYRSATSNVNTSLPIGTVGQVLQVNSGATAPEWATPAGGGATSYALINTGGTALTGATTINITGLSGYNKLFVMVNAASSVSAGSEISVLLNGASANYSNNANFIDAATAYSTVNFPTNNTTNKIILAYMANSAASVVRSAISIDGTNSTGIKTYNWTGAATNASSNGQYQVAGGGTYTDTNVISNISIVSQTGNFDAGTVFIYGA
jgi:hypothetical protein